MSVTDAAALRANGEQDVIFYKSLSEITEAPAVSSRLLLRT